LNSRFIRDQHGKCSEGKGRLIGIGAEEGTGVTAGNGVKNRERLETIFLERGAKIKTRGGVESARRAIKGKITTLIMEKMGIRIWRRPGSPRPHLYSKKKGPKSSKGGKKKPTSSEGKHRRSFPLSGKGEGEGVSYNRGKKTSHEEAGGESLVQVRK